MSDLSPRGAVLGSRILEFDSSPLDALRAKGMSGEELMVHAKTLREHLHHGFANVVEDEAERVLCLTVLECNARMRLLPPPVTLSLHLEAAKEVLMDLRCTASAERPSLGYLADLIETRLEAFGSEAIND